ncbi:hemicentin-1-like [Uloborus diversus]|uniref:hemicentin-1-like n=1 Tax=Uloborus diversus TaxID=327109 RepID=UPI002408FAE9|nr:hemicentin-1-like [Uloborus diversus]
MAKNCLQKVKILIHNPSLIFSTIVINPLTPEDSGNYTCIVSARGLYGSFTATLEVLVPPAWKMIPDDYDAVNGENVIFHCQGSGKPEPTTKWQRATGSTVEYVPLVGQSRTFVSSNGTMIITEITKEDEGMYKCIVTNNIGNSLMKNVILKVTEINSQKIQPFSFPNNTMIGNRVITTCATSTNEKMEFKWMKNGREIKNIHKTNIRSFPEFSTLIIDSLSEEDAGNYTCVASTERFQESFTTYLDVLVPASWVHQPTDLDVISGEKIVSNCEGNGKPHPIVAWYRTSSNSFDFNQIIHSKEETVLQNGSLSINAVSKDDEGMYKCNISNGVGKSLEKTILIRVIGVTALIQPFSFPKTSVVGKRVTTVCATTTGGKMEFLWMKDGKELLKNSKVIVKTFSEFSNLIIDPLSEEDSGNYTCVASSRGISESFTAVLEVLVPPAWKISPSDVEAVAGDSIILNCQGNGKPNPTVVWSHTGGSSSGFNQISASNRHELKQNGSIILKDVEKSHEGLYKCNISNGIGDSLIKTVIVKVIDGNLKVQPFSFPPSAMIGHRVSTMCATITAGNKMEFQWFKNGAEISKSNRIQVITFPEIANIIIDPLNEEDSGNYTCTVTTRGISDSYTAALNVLIPPTWKYKPNDVEARNEEKIFMNCAGFGKPIPTVKWTKLPGQELDLDTLKNAKNIIVHFNGTLEINNISKESEGMYQCIVSNGVGTNLKKDINVKVTDSWKIQPFTFSSARVGQRVSTVCTTSGGKRLTFEWLKDGKSVKEISNIKIISVSDVSTIIIEPVSEGDSGNYTCVANSEGMTDMYVASLNVYVPPEWLNSPSDKEVLAGETVTLSCSATGKPKPSSTWAKFNDIDGKFHILPADASSTDRIQHLSNGSLNINGISKSDEGIYQCRISNEVGTPLEKAASLHVIETWKIQPFSFPPSLTVGTRASTLCSTTTGKGLKFEWLKNGQRLNTSPNVQIRSYTDSSMILIEPLEEEDSGNYTCMVKSDFMSDSFTTSLTVLMPPIWIQKPTDKDILNGDKVSIPCHASGKPDAVVKWTFSKNEDTIFANIILGENIKLAQNGSLLIEEASKLDEGIYRCNASNGVGNSLIATMALKVIVAPKIQPFSFPKMVISGTKTSVTCTAISGSPPMEFKWHKNGHSLKMNQKTSVRMYNDYSIIFLEDVDHSSSGNYTCELLSSSGSDTYTTYLDVKEPPKWVKQPQDVALNSGANVTLECTASGHPLPNVTWKKATEGIRENFEIAQSQKQAPGKSYLDLKEASSSDGGFYICTADNGIDSIKTNGILITVSELPRIQKMNFPDQVTTGERTSIACTAISGTPPMEFKWFKNGHQIQQNQQFTIKTSSDFSMLFIENVSLSTSGNYTCELKTSTGIDRFTTVLEVKEPPKWLKEPKDLQLIAGVNVSLECEASGFPIPAVTWKKSSEDGKHAYEEVVHQKKIEGKSMLIIKEASEKNAGYYVCMAENGIANIQTNVIIIAISATPKIQPFNLATQFTTGEKVTLLCAIKSGTPPFSFQWLKNGQQLKEDQLSTVHQLTDLSNLVISALTLESRGNYTCKVSNAYGFDAHTEFLNVVVSPKWKAVPKDQESIAGKSITLECTADGYPEPVITWRIQSQETSNEPRKILNTPKLEIQGNTLNINGIEEDDEGNYACEASNGVGDGIMHTISVSVLGKEKGIPYNVQ